MFNALKFSTKWLFRLAILTIIAFAAWYYGVQWMTQNQIFDRQSAPENQVGVVFGARVYRSGRLSAMTADRVETAVNLYQAGKIDSLILSGGDNEPQAMMDYATRLGIPQSAMRIDTAGLRTYDTCYNAKHNFGLTTATLITQEFHLPRAIATCEMLGLSADGVIADQRTYTNRALEFSETREVPATLLAFVDVIRRNEP